MNAPDHPRRDRQTPLGWQDAPLLAEALATLAWSSAAIARMPFRRVAALASEKATAPERARGADSDRVAQAVEAWARCAVPKASLM